MMKRSKIFRSEEHSFNLDPCAPFERARGLPRLKTRVPADLVLACSRTLPPACSPRRFEILQHPHTACPLQIDPTLR